MVSFRSLAWPKFVSIRIILAFSVQLGLIIHTMDVNTAFLNASLDENIWVQIPPGTKLAMVMMAFTNC